MVCTTTREGRAERWRVFNLVAAAVLAFSTLQVIDVTGATAQVVKAQVVKAQVVKAPAKKPLHAPAKVAKQAPVEPQVADQLNAKWLAEHNQAAQATTTAAPAAGKDANTTPPMTSPTTTAPSTTAPSMTAPIMTSPTTVTTAGEEDKFAAGPSFGAPVGTGARAVIPGSVSLVKATGTAVFGTVPGGSSLASYKEVAQAFSGFAPAGPKVEMIKGQTADGNTRLLYASIGEGKSKQSFWWFAPTDQPQGWFDDKGDRLGGTVLAEPKPGSRISSPFGRRKFYGRVTSTAFHNGIDFEGKIGEPIHAAADGVVNHANWYYNYGRTVKITHADNFETLYAHMSRIAPGIVPGTVVHQGDVIGFVGSTGRSTGPHLHFSTIVNGEFVDPEQFLSEDGSGKLDADSLVAFRQWQQDIRTASEPLKKASATSGVPSGLQGGAEWSQNPFTPQSPIGPKPVGRGQL